MMIYPVSAGCGYLALFKATGDEKYLNAALTIARFYQAQYQPAGSWYLLYDSHTGKPLKNNLCVEFRFVDFFQTLYEITKDPAWRAFSEAHYRYISETCLANYNWEGQFEDVAVTGNYRNLTHFAANKLIGYIAAYQRDDAEKVEVAKDLMRFVEDQFVLWGEVPAWLKNADGERHTPAGLEQYLCYAPIDSSTAAIICGFANMYRLTGDRLYLEKAMALTDSITRMQDAETGQIPTFFIGENCDYGHFNYWINCQIYTSGVLLELAELTEAEGID
jgi:maltose/maltodextrin transport system substrate-binding protein